MKYSITILLFLFLVQVKAAQTKQIAYIYSSSLSSDSSAAFDYKTFLDSNGYSTYLIRMSDVQSTDFSSYSAILIGNGTGNLDLWGDSSSVAAINNFNKPVIGLGEGGYAYFGRLSLNIGWPHGWHGPASSMYIVQPQHTIFNTPNSITIPSDSVVTMGNVQVPGNEVGIYIPVPPLNVNLLGREVNESDTSHNHYPLVQEKTKYFIWGFSDPPSKMTQTGNLLFLNIVDYMIRMSQSTKIAYIFNLGSSFDSSAAFTYKSFLDSSGYSTTLINMDEVLSIDFSSYSAILIGDGTGNLNSWGNPSLVAAIDNAAKPIIGLGEGGYAYFGKLSLKTGYPNGWHGPASGIHIVQPQHAIFNTPHPIAVPLDSFVTMCIVPGNEVGICIPIQPLNVNLLGRELNATDTSYNHYPLVQEKTKYFLWGFSYPPSNMTQTANLLFLNIVDYMTRMSQSTTQSNPIAYYPLDSSPNDSTGNYGKMILTNTPFQDGGIYCNGSYTECHAETPVFPPSIFNSFNVTVKFKVDTIPTHENPVIRGGTGWRWIGILLNTDSTVTLYYNNNNRKRSLLHYSRNTWHEAELDYDSSNAIAQLYLDGTLACFARDTIIHGPYDYDRTFGISNPANATVFKGILKDLKIYSSAISLTNIFDMPFQELKTFQLSQNYPNPFNPSTTIRFSLPKASDVNLSIYNILGERITVLVSEHMNAGTHLVEWNASGFASGVYFYRLSAFPLESRDMQAGSFNKTRKLILIK
ncbi:MAG: T9SS type A sorting domain-containing protein [Bacteroidota bacterium]